MASETIVHFCRRDSWAAARAAGEYSGDTLASEGFIHCSPWEHVHVPANALALGRTDLVLLEIDPSRLTAPVRWEPSPTDGMTFPHVYGPIDLTAVVAVHDYQPGSDGTFAPMRGSRS